MIYLDYNATAPIRPEALAAMQPWLMGGYNASSVHAAGRKARMAVEAAREAIAHAVEADSANVIFTASGTESNHQALLASGARRWLVSAIEHPSVLKAVPEGADVVHIPVDAHGRLRLDVLESLLQQGKEVPTLLSIMLANNETGVIQPVQEATSLARRYGAMVHSDAVQALGKMPLSIVELGVDMLTLSAHKMGGALGAAALVLGSCFAIAPLLRGGGQERNRRAGTENIPAIIAFAEAVRQIDIPAMQQLAHWRDAMEERILAHAPDALVFGKHQPRLPNTSAIAMPGAAGHTQLMAFDLAGIGVSSGSACSSGKVGQSHVLTAMGIGADLAASAIRISGGWGSRPEDFDQAANLWISQYQRSRR